MDEFPAGEIVFSYGGDGASGLADWLETAISEGSAVVGFPEKHRRRIRTSNVLEQVGQEVIRRTRVIRISRNEDSC